MLEGYNDDFGVVKHCDGQQSKFIYTRHCIMKQSVPDRPEVHDSARSISDTNGRTNYLNLSDSADGLGKTSVVAFGFTRCIGMSTYFGVS